MGVRMVDVGRKRTVHREATARGMIELIPRTVRALREGKTKKGDVLTTAELAGILAAKKTHDLIPLCHPVPLTNVQVRLKLRDTGVEVECTVSANYVTGVEMEALTGAAVSLLSVWDMVKYLEKDRGGQYPWTRIADLKVVSKKKGK